MPVQTFLPSNDGGRDAAFVGRWDGDDKMGSSTIQCKFTSQPHKTLTPSLLAGEVSKVSDLSFKGLARDYIIITNHTVTGANEEKIIAMFTAAGVDHCRVFGSDWIVSQIVKSPRLRMMVPRLYGLGDLSQILDQRSYDQASMILSSMGDDLKKLVVTEAHRKSVRAVSAHNFVLLLGAPAAGKSTIGASLAVGAADIWNSFTLRATSPDYLQEHLNPNEKQFFWIDDAWGSTQYQRQNTDAWNRVLPLIQGAVKRGTRFLLTSRDYIWKAAKQDLKISALPLLGHSQVVINVHDLAAQERAQILYNHLKMGDQPADFRTKTKSFLADIASRDDFLPETARRFGSTFFTKSTPPSKSEAMSFFENPRAFLLETISNLAPDCKSAIALVFIAGGRIASPVKDVSALNIAADAFGTTSAAVREALVALNGSLLLLARDEQGQYWTYKHPTIGDAFASLVAANPELVELYLRGAKPDNVMREVVCAGVNLPGASVIVSKEFYPLLLRRIEHQETYRLKSFLSYRADRHFAELSLQLRPALLDGLDHFHHPIAEDSDASLLARLHQLGLLSDELRLNFVNCCREAAVEYADASFLTDHDIRSVLSEVEIHEIMDEVEEHVFNCLEEHVSRIQKEWGNEYDPADHFDNFEKAIRAFAAESNSEPRGQTVISDARKIVRSAIMVLEQEWEEPKKAATPVSSPSHQETSTIGIFSDVDE